MLLANFLVAQQVRSFSLENTEYRGVQSSRVCVRGLTKDHNTTTFEIYRFNRELHDFYLF